MQDLQKGGEKTFRPTNSVFTEGTYTFAGVGLEPIVNSENGETYFAVGFIKEGDKSKTVVSKALSHFRSPKAYKPIGENEERICPINGKFADDIRTWLSDKANQNENGLIDEAQFIKLNGSKEFKNRKVTLTKEFYYKNSYGGLSEFFKFD